MIATAIDRITITDQGAGKLLLSKWVTNISQGEKEGDKITSNKAGPGDTLQYTIGYTNTGAASISEVSITDQTPPFTVLETCSPSSPKEQGSLNKVKCNQAKGYRGELVWSVGELQPGESGTVSYQVKIE